jgi:hypothetical protein
MITMVGKDFLFHVTEIKAGRRPPRPDESLRPVYRYDVYISYNEYPKPQTPLPRRRDRRHHKSNSEMTMVVPSSSDEPMSDQASKDASQDEVPVTKSEKIDKITALQDGIGKG